MYFSWRTTINTFQNISGGRRVGPAGSRDFPLCYCSGKQIQPRTIASQIIHNFLNITAIWTVSSQSKKKNNKLDLFVPNTSRKQISKHLRMNSTHASSNNPRKIAHQTTHRMQMSQTLGQFLNMLRQQPIVLWWNTSYLVLCRASPCVARWLTKKSCCDLSTLSLLTSKPNVRN